MPNTDKAISAWEPIETAPKDGAYILVYPATWGGMTASPAKWNNDRYAKKPKPHWNRSDALSASMSRGKPPTHWMPMPEKPE